jgi:hypothetical protein
VFQTVPLDAILSFAQMFVKGGAMFLTSCAWFFYDLFYDFSMIYYDFFKDLAKIKKKTKSPSKTTRGSYLTGFE